MSEVTLKLTGNNRQTKTNQPNKAKISYQHFPLLASG